MAGGTETVRWALPLFCVLISLAVAVPSGASTESWTDEFDNPSLVDSSAGVVIGGGFAALGPNPLERQGIQVSSGSDIISPAIVKVGSEYFLYYAECSPSGSCAIALAVSSDSNSWTSQGIVVQPGLAGSTDAGGVAYEDVMVIGSTFRMWYSGIGSGGWYAIHHASSVDGKNWAPDGVVLSGATDGTNGATYYPSVFWDGLRFIMWYSTYNGQNTWIRRATSVDGLTWTPTGAVLSPIADGIDDSGPRMPSVIRAASEYIMWYTCVATIQGRLCRATSTDGIDWAREGAVLSPDPSLSGESRDVSQPDVLALPGATYRVWYAGRGSAGIDQIYSALPPSSAYVVSGSLVSVPIAISAGLFWQSLGIVKEEPAGTFVRVSVLNASSGQPIAGLTDLVATEISLASLSPLIEREIRLLARFTGGDSTPRLDRWTVTTGTAPPSPPTFWDRYLPAIVVSILFAVAGIGGAVFVLVLNRPQRPPRQPP